MNFRMLNRDGAARAAKGVSERFHELCQGTEERSQTGSRKVFLQQLLSSEHCKPTQEINCHVNPFNFQGIIFVLDLGTVHLVFVESSSTLSGDKERSSNDKYRKKESLQRWKGVNKN